MTYATLREARAAFRRAAAHKGPTENIVLATDGHAYHVEPAEPEELDRWLGGSGGITIIDYREGGTNGGF